MNNPKANLQVICRLMASEVPKAKERILATDPWTEEGLKAREALYKLFRRLVRLADATGNAEVMAGVEQLIDTFRSELPNWNRGGSVN